jgi:transcriptional regulator with XRE-family HTH domain
MSERNQQIKARIFESKPSFTALRRADLAHQFRSCMVEKKIRNLDLAERLGVSEANVSRWLNGTQNLSLDTMYGLADALEESLILRLAEPSASTAFLALDEYLAEENWKPHPAAANSAAYARSDEIDLEWRSVG